MLILDKVFNQVQYSICVIDLQCYDRQFDDHIHSIYILLVAITRYFHVPGENDPFLTPSIGSSTTESNKNNTTTSAVLTSTPISSADPTTTTTSTSTTSTPITAGDGGGGGGGSKERRPSRFEVTKVEMLARQNEPAVSVQIDPEEVWFGWYNV